MPKHPPGFVLHSVGAETPEFESLHAALVAAAPLLAKLIRLGEAIKHQEQVTTLEADGDEMEANLA